MGNEADKDFVFDSDRLAYGKIEGPGVTLAFQADDKAMYVQLPFSVQLTLKPNPWKTERIHRSPPPIRSTGVDG